MSRKTSTYARKRRAQHPQMLNPLFVKAYSAAKMMTSIKMARPYCENDAFPGEVEGSPDFMVEARRAMLQARTALDGLMRCEEPDDPILDFAVLKHAVSVTAIRIMQMIFGDRRHKPTEDLDFDLMTPDQRHACELVTASHKALNRAAERWDAGKGYGLDGEGRTVLVDVVELYETILLNSTPEQMQHAHNEVMAMQEGAVSS